MTDAATARPHGRVFSVIVLPAGPLGEQALDAARQWTSSGLLSPAAWVRQEDINLREGVAPEVQSHFLGPWGDAVTDLFETLGQYPRDLVRVLCCQIVPTARDAEPGQITVATGLLSWVRYSVPEILEREHVGKFGTSVLSANVITGVTGLSGVPDSLLNEVWDLNIVTSPEDRRDPQRANTWIRAGENLVSVALTSTAVVGGLFAGVDEGPFDRESGDASSTRGRIYVQRATVRAVIGERIVQEVARAAVMAAPTKGSPVLGEPESYTTSLGGGLVEESADWLDTVDGSALSRVPTPDDEELAPQFLSIRQGFLAFMRFYGQALLAGPVAVWQFVVRRAESFATGALVGGSESSGITLTVQPDASAGLAEVLQGREEQEIVQIRARIRDADKRPVRMPSAETWRSLRYLAEGLLDGSEVPPGAPQPKDGMRRILLASPEAVAPRPDDVFELSVEVARAIGLSTDAQRTMPACAPTVVEQASTRIHEYLEELQAGLEELDTRITEQEVLVEAEEKEDGPAHKVLVPLLAERSAALETLDRFQAEYDRLTRWMQERTASLMWTVGSRIHQRLEGARLEEKTAITTATTASGIRPDEPSRLRRRFLQWFTGLLVLALVAALAILRFAATAVTHLTSVAAWLQVWQVWLAWLLLILVVLTMLVRAWYVGVLAFLKRFTHAWNSRSRALFTFLRANSDRRRLEASADQAATWSDLVGWSAHTPWSTEPQPVGEQWSPPDPALLPESLRLAQPTLDEYGMSQATLLAMAAITRRGWRRRAYERLVAASTHSDDDSDVARALAMVEADPAGNHGIRSQVHEAFASGVPQQDVVSSVIEEAANELRHQRLGAARLQVHLERPEPDEPESVDDREFLGQALVLASPLAHETWSATAKAEWRHVKVSTRAWAPADVLASAPQHFDSHPIERHAEGRRDLVDVVVRVDVSEPVEVGELRLFEQHPNQWPQYLEEPSTGAEYV